MAVALNCAGQGKESTKSRSGLREAHDTIPAPLGINGGLYCVRHLNSVAIPEALAASENAVATPPEAPDRVSRHGPATADMLSNGRRIMSVAFPPAFDF